MIAIIEYFGIKIIKIIKIWLISKGVFGLSVEKNKKKYVISAVLVLLGVLVECLYLQNTAIIFPIIYIYVILFIFQGKMTIKLKAGLVSYLLVECLDTIVYAVIAYVGKIPLELITGYEHKLTDIICSMPSLLFWALISYICTNKKCCLNLQSRQFPLMFVSVFVATFQIAVVVYLIVGGQINQLHTVKRMILFLLFISSICVLYIFLYLTKLLDADKAQKQVIQALEKQNKINQRYYMDLYEKQQNEREQLHNWRHFLRYLHTKIKNEDYLGAESMLYEMTHSFLEEEHMLTYSQNKVVDAVICGVLGSAIYKNQILFSYQGILPEVLPVRDIDLCAVLSNALENALEATLRTEEKGKISMQASCQSHLLLFQIQNPVLDNNIEIVLGKSEKGDGHGLGIQSMHRIVEKYQGELTYTVKENVCKVDIIFLSSS